MNRMSRFDVSIAGREIRRYCTDDTATTAIEYAIVAAGVGVCIAGTVWNVGSTLKVTFYDKLASLLP